MTRQTVMMFFALAAITLQAGCGREDDTAPATDSTEPSMTEKALKDLQAKYDELAGDRLEDPMQWAADDLENIGDWEYKVIELGSLPVAEWEETFNSQGDERWQMVWIDTTVSGRVAVFKRPSVSLLSKIPLSQLGRMMIGDSGNEE